MKTLLHFIAIGLLATGLVFPSLAESPAKTAPLCPVSGHPADPKFNTVYEGKTYTFCSADCVAKFTQARADSLYQKIGGQAAIDAAVNLFYVKVLADKRVNHFFEDVSMTRQHNKQKAFLSAALGGPIPWEGKDMRTAHANLQLTDADFNVIGGHLQATLTELKVPADLIGQIMAIVESTRADVLNRPKTAPSR